MSAAATPLPDWHVAVDGCTNFRDAGGWPADAAARMRTGALYRSDDPVRITPAGRGSCRTSAPCTCRSSTG